MLTDPIFIYHLPLARFVNMPFLNPASGTKLKSIRLLILDVWK
ncbi:hypothetical protein psyc5s11_34110 [Clostridium gelidum]|uniref:Uncharacterized protein n=1 Tax=Clostridium gelidum TaxID=704125 RepID=A0ABN6IYZ6_9CLOT|nr:hypothetical protein psyc5s11_34110 [Clostridium gelidum]